MVDVLKDSEGDDYVSVRAVAEWLLHIEDRIVAECAGAPDGCVETRAYLYGEICSLRSLRRAVGAWKSAPLPAPPAQTEAE